MNHFVHKKNRAPRKSNPYFEGKSINIFLLDSHPITRMALRLFLETNLTCRIVAEASDCQEYKNQMRTLQEQPDVILWGLNGSETFNPTTISTFHLTAPSAHILILASSENIATRHQAMALGVKGVILKTQSEDVLIDALQRVCIGEPWESEESQPNKFVIEEKHLLLETAREKMASLNAQEIAIIELILKGLKNKDIASQLHLSEFTVRGRLSRIFSKLNVPDRVALAIYVLKYGLDQPDVLPESPLS